MTQAYNDLGMGSISRDTAALVACAGVSVAVAVTDVGSVWEVGSGIILVAAALVLLRDLAGALDRWSRRQVEAIATFLRSGGFSVLSSKLPEAPSPERSRLREFLRSGGLSVFRPEPPASLAVDKRRHKR